MTRFVPEIYAIDFGTSNSLLAAAARDGCAGPIALDPEAPDPSVLRSVLFFARGHGWSFGASAISEYARYSSHGRLFRSIKKYLPDSSFSTTQVGGHPLTLEDLIGHFLRSMRDRANRFFDADVKRVVLGRPARFSDDDAKDALAEQRLIKAAERAGFEEVAVYPEPLAAARDFRQTLTSEKLVLVADLGAGTSDFTVLTLRPDGYSQNDVRAIGGVSVAGDAFDSAIMRGSIARHFGSEIRYKVALGRNVLSMPRALTDALASPAEAALLERREVLAFLRDVRQGALTEDDKEAVERLIALAEDCLGFAVFQAIERSKHALSLETEAEFVFDYPTVDIRDRLTRDGFDRWSEKSRLTLLGALDETLKKAGVSPSDIDCVCLTGGTARVPALVDELAHRFGKDRILSHRVFHSVAQGLAMHAQSTLV